MQMDERSDFVGDSEPPDTHRGVDISVASNGFMLCQNEYTDRIDFVTPGDWASLGDPLDDWTLDQVRMATGQLTYVAHGTRPDVAAPIRDFPARISQLTYQDVRALDDHVAMAK